ncbi:aspartyl-phosphate phosphatase Spo0E family protein [Paenibacillus alvei]|uniref:aspartyl-phosphate phosphatase Spo0E family protein n=1 Tax=Paenibacillus alvei TaxID=44250 RepID=UPI0009DA3675|nr:aspartyl-phosphate phosphatase Spo0E family protein [Paenibacillus alvei]
MDKSINDQINNLRNKLIEVVREKQKFTDEEVVRISQQLDELIVKQQTIRFRKRKNSIK